MGAGTEIEVRGVRDAAEQRAVLELLPRVMGAPREFFASRYRHDPYGSPEHSRIVLADGSIVTHVRVYRRPVRLGWGEVWTGALGDVCTLPEHRLRGYAALALNDAARWLREQGAALCTILSGVGVYERVGWEKLQEQRFTFPAQGLLGLPLPGDVTVRHISRTLDQGHLAGVYEAHAEGRSLTVVRSGRYWQAHFDMALSERADAGLLAERDGRPVAHIRCAGDGPVPTILEAPYLPGEEAACSALADALGRLAVKRGLTAFAGHLPAGHPLTATAPHERTETSHLLVRLLDLPAVVAAGLRGTLPGPQAPPLWGVRCAGQAVRVRSAGDRWAVEAGEAQQGPLLEAGQATLLRVLLRLAPPSAGWGRQWGWLDAALGGPAPVYWRADGV